MSIKRSPARIFIFYVAKQIGIGQYPRGIVFYLSASPTMERSSVTLYGRP